MGRPMRCCGGDGDCQRPVVTCRLENNIIYFTVDNAVTANIRTTQRNSAFYFNGPITLDQDGHAEGQINVSSISVNGNFPPFNSGYYELRVVANNECGSDSCEIKCGMVISSTIFRKNPNCYIPVPCSIWGIPPIQTCYGDGPYILQWSVRIYSNGDPPTSVTITINGNSVTSSDYDESTNTYSGEIQVDRCDLAETYTIEANIEACGTQIFSTSTYTIPCMDRKNAFVIEISGLSDWTRTSTSISNFPGAEFYSHRLEYSTGLSGYNGTYVFPIDCYPIFDRFSNRYIFDRQVTPNPILLESTYTTTTIDDYTYSSFPFVDGFVSVDEHLMRVSPMAPCSPLGYTRKSLEFTRLGGPLQRWECPGAPSPYCGGLWNCTYGTRLIGTDIIENCNLNNPGNICGYLTQKCELGVREYDILQYTGDSYNDIDNPNNNTSLVLSVIGKMRAYYDCL